MDIQNRVVNYYKNNSFIQKYLKGIDPTTNEVVLDYNGETRRVNIDSLEKITDETSLTSFFQGNTVAVAPSVEPMVSGPSILEPQAPVAVAAEETPAVSNSDSGLENAVITPVAKEQTMLVDNTNLKQETLNDIKLLTELKNKEGLDNLLKKFAVNPNTGLIDINSAISIVTKNTMNEVEKAIKNNYEFSVDPSQYDPQGNFIGTPTTGLLGEDEQIAKSFNNIKIYLDASKMYPEQANYNDEQIKNFMQTYISKVKRNYMVLKEVYQQLVHKLQVLQRHHLFHFLQKQEYKKHKAMQVLVLQIYLY